MNEPTTAKLIVEDIVWDDDGEQTGLPTTITLDWWGDHPNDAPDGFVDEQIAEHLTRTYAWVVADFSWRVA
ncbi:hypothetical protein [Sphingomonas aracearum]|uniref:Uncharacterized protein n=1 Tax=Sphingomonas aracearum TaxID=2283317 RepID=A0A369VWM4_9SPHN|nr:hypothetical protein [Sphingomonas aracearum]RDE06786.1 hypothetical protein DVW87_03625 [Sphingomonas aracearum]